MLKLRMQFSSELESIFWTFNKLGIAIMSVSLPVTLKEGTLQQVVKFVTDYIFFRRGYIFGQQHQHYSIYQFRKAAYYLLSNVESY